MDEKEMERLGQLGQKAVENQGKLADAALIAANAFAKLADVIESTMKVVAENIKNER